MSWAEFWMNGHEVMSALPFNEIHIMGALLIAGFGFAIYKAATEEV